MNDTVCYVIYLTYNAELTDMFMVTFTRRMLKGKHLQSLETNVVNFCVEI